MFHVVSFLATLGLDMSAIHPFLNTITSPNSSYFDRFYDQAFNSLMDAMGKIKDIADKSIPPLDMANTVPNTSDPSLINISSTLPSAPIAPNLHEVVVGTMPTRPVLTTDLVASDSILSSAISRIVSEITYRLDNPTGLKYNVESGIWNRGIDRATRSMRNNFMKFKNSAASIGWSRPQGIDNAAYIAFNSQKNSELSSLNREIMVNQANLEQQNLQQALTLFQQFQSQLFDQKSNDEGRKIALYQADMEKVLRQAELYININQGIVGIYNAQVQAYSSVVGAESEKSKLLLSQVEAINSLNIQLENLYLERIKVKYQIDQTNYNAYVEAAKGSAAVLAQVGASMFNAINITQSFGTTKSWGYDESVNT